MSANSQIMEHYNRPEVKEAIMRFCDYNDGWRALNRDITHWYNHDGYSEQMTLIRPELYDSQIRPELRTLYATLNVYCPLIKFKPIPENKEDRDVGDELGTFNDTIAYTLAVDIDSIKGSAGEDIHFQSIKSAVEAAGQFFVDYLKEKGISQSVHVLQSGGGIYVMIHHELCRIPSESSKDKCREYFIWLTKAMNKLIKSIEEDFFSTHPEHKGKVKFDAINNQRRIFKTIYSIHKKYPYAVIPLDKANIKIDFEKAQIPLKQEVLEQGAQWYKDFDLNERDILHNLLLKSLVPGELDYSKIGGTSDRGMWTSREPIPKEKFPPCMKRIIDEPDEGEGKTRKIAVLASYLGHVGWNDEDAYGLWREVAEGHGLGKRQDIFQSWYKKMICPRCEKLKSESEGFPHVGLEGLDCCRPDDLCQQIKWPLHYGRVEDAYSLGILELAGKQIKVRCDILADYLINKLHIKRIKDNSDRLAIYKDGIYVEGDEAKALTDKAAIDLVKQYYKGGVRKDFYIQASAKAPVVSENDWNPHRELLCCENGVVNLQTGELLDFSPEYLMINKCPTPYNPGAVSPIWEKFMQEVFPDKEVRDYMQVLTGYSITGETREQSFFILRGEGANGKSVFTDTLIKTLGDYAYVTPTATFTRNRNDRLKHELAQLRGKRLVITNESSHDSAIDDELVKQITGGSKVTARDLYQKYFTYEPHYTIWFITNPLPRAPDLDRALLRRIKIIEFTESFEGREDRTLADRLLEEKEGILSWAVKGAAMWYKSGLAPTQSMKDSLQQYVKDEDPLFGFVETMLTQTEPGIFMTAEEAYSAWCEYADAHHLENMIPQQFGKKLNSRLLQLKWKFGKIKTNGQRIYAGIKLKKETWDEPVIDHPPIQTQICGQGALN